MGGGGARGRGCPILTLQIPAFGKNVESMTGRASWIDGSIFFSPDGQRSLHAWEPYSLCVSLLFDLENSEIEPRWGNWQIRWIAGLALLRTIGHVLQNLDTKTSKAHSIAIKQKWDSWKSEHTENWIFWDFIQKERNNILKEFDLGFVSGPYLEPEEYEVEPIVYHKLAMFREAVYWWRVQLRELELELGAL